MRQAAWPTANATMTADALATIGIQYKGQFQISTRVRVTEAIDGCTVGIVFWYEGPQDYYRLDISPELGGRAVLRRIEAGQTTDAGQRRCDARNRCRHLVRSDRALRRRHAYRLHPSHWKQVMAGMSSSASRTGTDPNRRSGMPACSAPFPARRRPRPSTWMPPTRSMVKSTTGFPSSGEIKVDNEIIGYSSKTATQFRIGQRPLARSAACAALERVILRMRR